MTIAGAPARILVFAAAMLAIVTMPAAAATLTFKANIQGVAGSNSKATGILTAEYDTDTKKLSWQGRYRGLGTYATGANFHGPAAPDQNAGIVLKLRNYDSPFNGTAILSNRQASQLTAGKWYILIRTAAHPAGELRGQLTP